MLEDPALLRSYADSRDEAAFTEFVRRHIDGVYSIARRRVGGDDALAADVAQQVFLTLARQARQVADHPALVGWLYTTTRNHAANLVRAERRSVIAEQEAHAMQDLKPEREDAVDWSMVAPVLENAMDMLGSADRVALLLRFIERRTFAEIGATLRLTEEAARKRVERAAEKLRIALRRRGVRSTASALTLLLSQHAVGAAPTGLATAAAGAALSGAASGGGSLAFLAVMSTFKLQSAAVVALLVAGTLGLVWQQHARAALADELSLVRRDVAEVERLRADSARLERAADGSASAEHAELLQLRNEAARLQDRLTQAAPSPTIPLAAGMVPANAWQNRGRTTPGRALETLLWAKEGADFAAIARMMSFDPRTRSLAEEAYASMPADVRARFDLTSPEKMVALAWSLGPRTSMTGAAVTRATPEGTDLVQLQLNAQRDDGGLQLGQRLQFRNTAEGWEWVVGYNDFENAKRGWGELMRGHGK